MKHYLFIIALIAIATISHAEDRSVILTYPTGYRVPDMSNRDDVKALNTIASAITGAKEQGKKFRIECLSYCSPLSDNPITRNIGESRSEELANILEDKGLIRGHELLYKYGGVGWILLKEMVESQDLRDKDAVLQILSKPDEVVMSNVHDNQQMIVEGLKKINKGKVWNEIKHTVIPVIRNTLYVSTSGGKKLSIRYPMGFNKIDLNYDGNLQKTEFLVAALKSGETVNISYSPNPGGDNDIYRNIAETRAKDLCQLLIEESHANPGKISFGKSNDGWYDLRNLIATSGESWSNEALDVIDNYRSHLMSSNKSADDVKLKLLKKLNGGKTYEELKTRLFPMINNILVVKVIIE